MKFWLIGTWVRRYRILAVINTIVINKTNLSHFVNGIHTHTHSTSTFLNTFLCRHNKPYPEQHNSSRAFTKWGGKKTVSELDSRQGKKTNNEYEYEWSCFAAIAAKSCDHSWLCPDIWASPTGLFLKCPRALPAFNSFLRPWLELAKVSTTYWGRCCRVEGKVRREI